MDYLLYVLMAEEWLQDSRPPTWLNKYSLYLFSIYVCYIIYMSWFQVAERNTSLEFA